MAYCLQDPRCELLLRAEERLRGAINGDGLPDDATVKSFGENWLKLCAAMDQLEDTTLAIDAYLHPMTTDPRVSDGATYLQTYGVLQAIILQQDAIAMIEQCLGSHSRKHASDSHQTLRLIRNRIVGHPLDKCEPHGQQRSVWGIVRISLGKGGKLKTYNWGANGHQSKVEEIDMTELIRSHCLEARAALLTALRQYRSTITR